MSTFAERLYKLRRDKKLARDALGLKIGVSKTAIKNWEDGENLPKVEYVKALAEFFDVSFDWLATGQGSKQTNQQIVDELIASMPNGITYDQIEPWRQQTWVEVYDLRFCCGDGGGYAEFEPLKKTLPFDDSFFCSSQYQA